MKRYRWLLLRRTSQLLVLALFLAGPYFDTKQLEPPADASESLNLSPIGGPVAVQSAEPAVSTGPGLGELVEGSLNSADILGILPLTDPLLFLQGTMAAGWTVMGKTAVTGVLVVLLFYLAVGGRAYCSWVCPVNMITDFAHWLRTRTGIGRHKGRLSGNERYLLLAIVLVASLISGVIAFEVINPVSILHRGLLYGLGLGWAILAALFLYDLLVEPRGWCSHLCPIGAFYSLVGRFSLVRVRFHDERCDRCGDCFPVCPEPQVLKPSISGGAPRILSGNCTNCGNCIDICHADALDFATRFRDSSQPKRETTP